MRNHSNSRYQAKRTNYVGDYATYLFDVRNARQIQREQQQQLVRRIRRVSRVAIIATKNNLTSRNRRFQLKIRQVQSVVQTLRSNQYRIAAASLVVLTAVSVVVPPFIQATDTRPVTLDAATSKLVGETRDDAAKYLQYSATDRTYSFKPTKQEIADFNHTGRNADAYDTTFSQNADDGITVTDNKTSINITLKPDFFTANARKSTGNHIVYKSGRTQLIYSLKYNGLKEDIVIPSVQGSSASYSFRLVLPSGVEARLDERGNIGIYSGDSSLYGNISYGSDDDRAKVEKARANSPKTNLVMTIPYPIVKDAHGQEYTDLASFQLGKATKKPSKSSLPSGVKDTLTNYEYPVTVSAHGLAQLSYPISIDPTIQLSNSAEFSNLNLESGVDVDTTNNLIKRAGLTGGMVNTWSSTGTGLIARYGAGVAAYNGFIYVTGGCITYVAATCSTITNSVQKASISSTGIGTWTNEVALPETIWQHTLTAYNGNLYLTAGGNTAGATPAGTTHDYIMKLKNDGSFAYGNWVQSNGPTGRLYPASVAANNAIITVGGHGSGNVFTNVYYQIISADGTVDNNSTTPLLTGVWAASATYYNGYIYITGGCTNDACPSYTNTVQYAKVNSNGSVGAWATTTSLPTARYGHTSWVSNGYLYVGGGQATGTLSDVQFAPIYTNGTIGYWTATTSMGTARSFAGNVASGGSLYVAGGLSATTLLSTSEYTTTRAVGELNPWVATSSLPSGSWAAAAIATNGYLYYVGGLTTDCSLPGCTARSTVYYASINTDGSVGSWNTTTSYPVGIAGNRLVSSGGYLYSLGGATTCLADATFGFICSGSASVYYSAIAANGTLGTWTATTAFTNGRYHLATAIYGGKFIYITGGATSNGSTQTIYNDAQVAPLNSDGTVGTWTGTTTLPRTLGAHGMTVSGQFIYLVGGSGTPSPVYYASINSSSGALGSWTSTTSISTHSYYTVLYADKGYLYTYSASADSSGDPVRYSKINSDGSVGNWTTLNSYATTRYQSAGAFYNDKLYVMSGSPNSNVTSFYTDVQYGTINHGGTGVLSAWTNTNKSLAVGHTRGGLVALNGYLYMLSGCTSNTNPCTALTPNVEYTAINSDGSLVGWANTTATITARQGASYYAYNGRIYAQGGQSTSGGVFTRTIQFATPDPNGDITSWTTNSINTPTDEGYGGVVVYNGYAYRVAGINGVANGTNVSSALIDASTGQVGSWTSLNSTNLSHQSHGLALYKNYIYVVSGNGTPSIEYAAINADHSITAWKLTGGSGLNYQRQEVASVATNGSLCTISGYNANLNRLSSSECAPILSDGSIDFTKLTSSVVASDAGHSVVLYNGFIYKAGGSNSSADPTLTVESTRHLAIPRMATFSKLYDFDTGVKPTKLIIRGSKQTGSVTPLYYLTSNDTSTTLDNTQTVSDAGYSTNATTISQGNFRTLSRYVLVRFTIDDSQATTFPDTGNESTITDFDLYYTSNPGARLRGGRTFTNGVDRGLDAQPQ